MSRHVFSLISACLLLTAFAAGANHTAPAKYAKPRLSFEPNVGQTDARVSYLGRNVFFTNQGATLKLPVPGGYLAVAMKFEGDRKSARITGESPMPGRSNYLIGNPANWHTGIPQFARVHYRGVYPGVDFVFYQSGRSLEYDIALAPDTDVNHVRLTFEGVDSLRVDANGDLTLHTKAGDLRQLVPAVYQRVNGRLRRVRCHYRLLANNQVGFTLGAHDRGQAVVIDPVLRWSTCLGGIGRGGAAPPVLP